MVPYVFTFNGEQTAFMLLKFFKLSRDVLSSPVALKPISSEAVILLRNPGWPSSWQLLDIRRKVNKHGELRQTTQLLYAVSSKK